MTMLAPIAKRKYVKIGFSDIKLMARMLILEKLKCKEKSTSLSEERYNIAKLKIKYAGFGGHDG